VKDPGLDAGMMFVTDADESMTATSSVFTVGVVVDFHISQNI
jgi:hypothetical protein